MRPGDLNEQPASWLAARLERPSLARYAQALRSRLWLVIAFVAVALAASIAYVSVAPKAYRAEADVLVTPVSPDDPNLVGLSLVRDTDDPSSDVLTVSKLVTSPSVVQRVAAQIGGSPAALVNSVQATPVTESEIIAVDATAATAARATAIADAFATQTINEQTDTLHTQLATLIPALRATMKGLSPTEGSALAAQLAVLQTLALSPDPTVRVSSTATPPTAPYTPNTKLSLLAGGFGGLILGILAVFGMQALDPRLRDEDQLRELYRLPLLARIPRQRSGRAPIAPRQLATPAAEAFRNLRAAYTISAKSGDRGRTILITGDNASNGKTTVALNLAASLAAAGKQAILIEADLRRPSIAGTLKVKAANGIAEVLRGEVALVDALIWVKHYGPQLELLLGDVTDEDSLDRMPGESVERLVRQAAEIADFVIIDSPPLTDVSDAVAFADVADDVVLVARVGRSQVRRLNDLGELLHRRAIKPAGVILVGTDRSESYSYYYGERSRQVAGRSHLWGLLQRRVQTSGDAERNGHVAELNGHGAVLNGHVAELNGHGAVLNGHVAELNGHGPGLGGHGAAPQ